MKRPGAIAAQSMALYRESAEEEAVQPSPATPTRKPRSRRKELGPRWHPPNDFALVAFGFKGDQVAQVLVVDRKERTAIVRKWSTRQGAWRGELLLPLGRLLGRPKKNDPRLLAARANLILPPAPPAPELIEKGEP